jgi:hypothetical protein
MLTAEELSETLCWFYDDPSELSPELAKALGAVQKDLQSRIEDDTEKCRDFLLARSL